MSIPQEFHKFSTPTLFYDEGGNRILSSGKIKRKVPSSDAGFFDRDSTFFADRDHYFFCGGDQVKVFDSFTGEEVLSLTTDSAAEPKGFKAPAGYFPFGKIAYSACNTHLLQGEYHSDPSSLRIERLLVVEEDSFSVVGIPEGDGKGKTDLLFKFNLKERSFMSQEDRAKVQLSENKEILEEIESAAFLTRKDILVMVRIGGDRTYQDGGYPPATKEKFSFFALVDITTGDISTLYPRPFDPDGPSFNTGGDIFPLPTGELVALTSEDMNRELLKIRFENGHLELSPTFPEVTFDLNMVYILPPYDEGGDGELFGLTTNGELLELNEGEWEEKDIKVASSAIISPYVVAAVEQYDEVVGEAGETAEVKQLKLSDVGSLNETDVHEDFSFQVSEVFWLGDGLTCLYAGKDVEAVARSRIVKFFERGSDPDEFLRDKFQVPLFEFPKSKIVRSIPLRNSKKWRKFMRENLEDMVPIASALADVILGFI